MKSQMEIIRPQRKDFSICDYCKYFKRKEVSVDFKYIEGYSYALLPNGSKITIPGSRLVSDGGFIEMCQHPECFGDQKERVSGQYQHIDDNSECKYFEVGTFGRVKLGIDNIINLFRYKLTKQSIISFFLEENGE